MLVRPGVVRSCLMERMRPRGERKRIEILRAAAASLSPPRLSRCERRSDRQSSEDGARKPLLLLPEQGGDSLRLSRLFARTDSQGTQGRRGEQPAARPADSSPHCRVRASVHRRPARHRVDTGSGGALAAPPEEGHCQTRPHRQGIPKDSQQRHAVRPLRCSGTRHWRRS